MVDLQKNNLGELEAIIRDGLEQFYLVGNALREVRDRKLFLEVGFDSFEVYCRERWQISQSMGYHIMSASNVIDSLEGDILPKLPSHAAKLHVIKDDYLRNKAWQDVLDTELEVTGQLVEKFAKKWWLVENSKEFGNLVLTNQITPDHGIDLYKALRTLPPYYKEIAVKHPSIEVGALRSLRELEYAEKDEFLSILTANGLDNGRDFIPIDDLTARDIDSYIRRVKWEESQLNREVQSEIQIAEIQKQGLLILDGIDVMEGLVENSGSKSLVYIFPEQVYDMRSLAEILEKYNYETFVIGVYTKNNEPDIRLHGNVFAKPSTINGTKPDYLLRAFEHSVLTVN